MFWREVNSDKSPEELERGEAGLRELEGGFIGGLSPNDMVYEGDHHSAVEFRGRRLAMDLPGCCSPSGMRAVYLAWANTVLQTPLGVMVNLPFDRDAPEASVVSGLPRDGRLTVTTKTASDFWLRPPSWAPRDQVAAWRNGRAIEARWGGPAFDYVGFAAAEAGETLELTWPLVRFKQQITQRYTNNSEDENATFVDGPTYSYSWTGSTVTSVEPRGEWLPLYT